MRHLLAPALLVLALPCQQPHAVLPNQGQWPAHVQAAVKHGALVTWLTDAGFTTRAMVTQEAFDPRGSEGPDAKMPSAVTATVDVDLVGAAPGVLAFDGRLPGIEAFFVGNDPAQWAPSVARFASATRRDVWPGVDLVFGTRDGALCYDLRFAPGAAVGTARLCVRGHQGLRLGSDGALELDLGIGTLRHGAPRAWQVAADGTQRPLEAAFVVDGDVVTFAVPGRDVSLPLVIDPPLLWNVIIGGTLHEGPGYRHGVDRDPVTGDLYVCGWTNSPGTAGGYDGFVCKYDVAGTLLWRFTIGGSLSGDEWIKACRFDGSGGVWFGGFSSAPDFPISPVACQANQGPLGVNHFGDMVVGHATVAGGTNPQLTLTWSRFLGGPGEDCLNSLVVVPGGVAISGWTASSSSPTPMTHAGAAQPTHGGSADSYIAVLDPSQPCGQQVVYGTYWGGNTDDVFSGIERDSAGLLVVGGNTDAPNFPTTTNAIQTVYQGGTADGTITCFDPTLSAALYSSYVGGTGWDAAYEIAIDAADRWVVGNTTEFGLATPLTFPATAFQPVPPPGPYNGFVLVLDPQQAPASQLVWGTYLGGMYQEALNGLAVDAAGRFTVTGSVETHVGTAVTDFPVTAWCLQPTPIGGPTGLQWDAFVARIDPRRTGADQLVYSTFLGGDVFDYGDDVVLDERARPIVLGRTNSTTLLGVPSNGGRDVFLAYLDLLAGVADRYGAPSPSCAGVFLDGYHQQIPGGFDLTVTVTAAPANAIGALVFGLQNVPGTPLLGLVSYLSPPTGFGSVLLQSDASGCADHRFQAMLPPPTGLAVQTAWIGGCAPSSPFVTSDAIRL